MSTWTSMQGRGSVQSRLTSVAQSHGTAVEHNELGCPCWVEKLWSWLGRESFVLVTYMWVVVSARLHIMLGCMRPYRPTVPRIGQRRRMHFACMAFAVLAVPDCFWAAGSHNDEI